MSPDADRWTFHDIEIIPAGVNVVELAQWVLAMQLSVTVHSRPAVRARLDDSYSIQDTLSLICMSFQSFDHQPLVRIRCPHL